MCQYRDGDLRAFQELYKRHNNGLYRFIAWRAPRRDWVEEIVQDSWANLHKARERYEVESSFRTYLYQIARNRLFDLLRQQPVTLASEMGGEEEYECFAIADDSSSPEMSLQQKQQVQKLHMAIRTLPNEQKEALVLQQFNGLSLEEISELTAVPLETVKSRLRYAMQKLRAILQERQGELA
ncbi:MAG: sigma-70 family RNA polymerase sigma factor [Burkholderiales bacterium]|nr:sigma-70 family RNA polymerase sigma factor [Burkholderiales bacterium]